jgi:hypothetical protein
MKQAKKTWKKRLPTENGYYWCRHEDSADSFMVRVATDNGKFAHAFDIRRDQYIPDAFLPEHEWAGPLQPPKE